MHFTTTFSVLIEIGIAEWVSKLRTPSQAAVRTACHTTHSHRLFTTPLGPPATDRAIEVMGCRLPKSGNTGTTAASRTLY